MCVCIQIRLFQLEGGGEGSLCHRPHSPSHSEFSHSREVGWRLVQTQNIYCPRIFIVPLVSKETCPFFSLFGDGWRMEFFPPHLLAVDTRKGNAWCRERDRLQTDGGRVSV